MTDAIGTPTDRLADAQLLDEQRQSVARGFAAVNDRSEPGAIASRVAARRETDLFLQRSDGRVVDGVVLITTIGTT
jgi:hypothetical protein